MLPIIMITFCKDADCPASQKLLAFQKGETSAKENTLIREHLESCEFCTTEVDFYTNFPQNEEKVDSVDIPQPLYQLAEALLNNRQQDFSILNKLLTGKESAAVK